MFENLTNKFEEVFSSLKKAPSLDEKQVDEGLRGIRQALLEADVTLDVAKQFIENVKPKALGLTLFTNSFATERETSASSNACLIFLSPSSTCFSSSEGDFFKEENISSNLFVKFSNIITHSSKRTSGRTLAD